MFIQFVRDYVEQDANRFDKQGMTVHLTGDIIEVNEASYLHFLRKGVCKEVSNPSKELLGKLVSSKRVTKELPENVAKVEIGAESATIGAESATIGAESATIGAGSDA